MNASPASRAYKLYEHKSQPKASFLSIAEAEVRAAEEEARREAITTMRDAAAQIVAAAHAISGAPDVRWSDVLLALVKDTPRAAIYRQIEDERKRETWQPPLADETLLAMLLSDTSAVVTRQGAERATELIHIAVTAIRWLEQLQEPVEVEA